MSGSSTSRTSVGSLNSGETVANGGGLTTAQVLAANNAGATEKELGDAVDDANAHPAPANPVDAFMANMSADMALVKQVLGITDATLGDAARIVGAFPPAAGTVLSRIAQVEQLAVGLAKGINTHFNGKVPTPDATAVAVSSAAHPINPNPVTES